MVAGFAGNERFFGNGEFGPVGGVNFVRGYTAAAAFFVEQSLVCKTPRTLSGGEGNSNLV